jgi:hypothetical protein
VLKGWLSFLRQCILDAQELGELNSEIDVTQLVFEIEAVLLAANFLFLMANDSLSLRQGRLGVENVLTRCAARVKSQNTKSLKKSASRGWV